MKLKVITYDYDQTAIYFIEQGIMLFGTEQTEIRDEEHLEETFFDNHIQGRYCDRCAIFEDVEYRFTTEEITI